MIDSAELLIGSKRLLGEYGNGKPQIEAVTASAVKNAIRNTDAENICVLYSGDSGFYSGARLLLPELAECDVCLLPGISSVQHFAAQLKRPWQDWLLCSAHGVDCDAVAAVCQGRPTFFLTGGKTGPAAICRELTEVGLGFLKAYAGDDLGTERERITAGAAAEFAANALRRDPLAAHQVSRTRNFSAPRRCP